MFLDDSVCPHAAAGGKPPTQGLIQLEAGMRERRQLPFYRDFLRGSETPLWCDVVPFAPQLSLHWRYTEEQAASAQRWECPTVWLHSAAHDNGAVYLAPLYQDLCTAVNQLAQTKGSDAVRYSLLVRTEGMQYDKNRLGGDCPITTPSGRQFTFSVRRDTGDRKLLLAIAWN